MENLENKITELVDAVKQLKLDYETKDNTVKRIEATMMVNYGPTGRTIPELLTGKEPVAIMVETVLKHYNNLTKCA